MKKFTPGQYALGGFAFILIWVLILSQNANAYLTGFAILFANPTYDYGARTPLTILSIVLWSLALWCFYKATRSPK